MSVLRLDHVQVAVPALAEAAASFEQLGLRLTPETRHEGTGTANRAFFVGEGAAEFYVELVAIVDEDAAAGSATGRRVLAQLAAGGGPRRLLLAVEDIEGEAAALGTEPYEVRDAGGRLISRAVSIEGREALGADVALVEYPEDLAARSARHVAAGLLGHALALARLDHLALLTADLDAATGAWIARGGRVAGEIATPGAVIRQVAVGGAILELIAPAGDSPLVGRPPGLLPVAAFEVPALDAAIAHARAAGFAVADAALGVIPGTRRSTIPAPPGSISIQLLEYV